MRIGLVGLGYVGLPLAVAFCEAGHDVIGVDSDGRLVEALRRGHSHVEDVPSEALATIAGRFTATTRYADLVRVEAIVVAVPTPLTRNREPDLQPLVAAGTALAGVLQEGQLVVLESTTYPGTTRERLMPLLEESGLAPGGVLPRLLARADRPRAHGPSRCGRHRRSSGPSTRSPAARQWRSTS